MWALNHSAVPCDWSLNPCSQLLWGEGGVKRFYRGFTPCIIRAAPANGVMLLTVEKVNALLNKSS